MNQNEQLEVMTAQVTALQEQMSETLMHLYADMEAALAEWRKNTGDQYRRRILVRCIFATIEAVIWNIKNSLPKLAEISGVQLSSDEIAVATEVRIVEKDGQRIEKKNFLRFRDNLKATFRIFGKVYGVTYTIQSPQGLDALCDTYEVRNRLMHPKTPTDPIVTDEDIRVSQQGVAWLSSEFNTLFRVCNTAKELKVLTAIETLQKSGLFPK